MRKWIIFLCQTITLVCLTTFCIAQFKKEKFFTSTLAINSSYSMPLTNNAEKVITEHRTALNVMIPLINHVRKGSDAGRFSIKSLQLAVRAGFIQPRYAATFLTHDLYQLRVGLRFIYFKGGKNLFVGGASVVQQGDQVVVRQAQINYNGYLLWHGRISNSFGINAGIVCSENNPGIPCLPLLGFYVRKYPFSLNAFFPRSISAAVQLNDNLELALNAQFLGYNIDLHREYYKNENFSTTGFLHRQLVISSGTEITIAKGRIVTPMIGYAILQRVRFNNGIDNTNKNMLNNVVFSLSIALGKRYQSESTDAFKFLRSFGVGHRSFLNAIE
ncbi:MAG: hypothetical protein IPO27_15100 [Bacteroidetes bacterium]|nr:hypothetical protein [Bacteroidota bacterium]